MTSTRPGTTFWNDIKRIFDEGTPTSQSDEQLLTQFASAGDEVAFAALVARYGQMVAAVSRSMLRDQNDVEDAFQATFLVLVRRAGSIHQGVALGAWLHRVAVRVALEANRNSVRKRAGERKAMERLTTGFQVDEAQEDRAAVLHQELDRLSGRYRFPIVLCYLQDLTHAQAAAQLGLSVGTLRRRLAKGRKLLRARLSHRGVGLMASLSNLSRSPSVGMLVPSAWINSATMAAKDFTVRTGSTTAAALAVGVDTAMFFTRTKLTTATLAVAATSALVIAVMFPGRGGGVEPPLLPQNSVASSSTALETSTHARPDGGSVEPAQVSEKSRPPEFAKTSSDKVWATITVRLPIERLGRPNKHILVYFAMMSDSDEPLVPRIKSSKLLINGQVYEDWPNIVSDVSTKGSRGRVMLFNTLRPDEGIVFGHHFENVFSKPGIYRVRWEGDGFRSPEIMFRVVPERKEN